MDDAGTEDDGPAACEFMKSPSNPEDPTPIPVSDGLWASVSLRIGTLIGDSRPNVRSNLAMVAAALAGEDPSALRELSRIAIGAWLDVLDDVPGAERIVSAVLKEREQFGDELRTQLDAQITDGLAARGEGRANLLRAKNLLRLPSEAVAVLPPPWLADSILNETARYAAMSAPEQLIRRGKVRKAIERLAQLQNDGSPDFKQQTFEALRGELDRLGEFERRGILFALLSICPRLVSPNPGGPAIASTRQLLIAVRASRPRQNFRRVMNGALDAIWAAAIVAVTTAIYALIRGQVGSDRALFDAFATIGILAPACFVGCWPIYVLFIPSIGRTFKAAHQWPSVFICSAMTALTTSLAIIFFDSIARSIRQDSTEPVYDWIPFVFMMSSMTCAVIIILIPRVRELLIGLRDWSRLTTVVPAAAFPVLIVSLLCGIASWTHFLFSEPLRVWQSATASTFAIAFAVYELENAMWPLHVDTTNRKVPRKRNAS